MHRASIGWRRLSVLGAVAMLIAAACGTSGNNAGNTVTVIGTWAGSEQDAFLAMVKPWEAKTGNKVKYTGTRDINTVLTTGVASGVLPDLAGLPGPGQMAEYAKAGALKPLDGVLDAATYKSETAKALVDLGTVDGKLTGVFIKAAVKGLIWYNPKVYDYSAAPPATWDELMSQAKANKGNAAAVWCLGLGSGAASGWPGTDWIEDIVLRQAGPQVYNDWWAGKVKWSSPEIKAAFQTYLDDVVANIADPVAAVDPTKDFSLAGDPLFSSPPGCVVFHQASFITGLGAFKDKKAGTDYNFFPFPDIKSDFAGSVEGAGDLFGMFRDTEPAKSLMKYLVTAEAQDIWVKAGGALSANKNATSYPDDISKRSAEMLVNAKTFVFDASDLMPSAMNSAFWSAMLDVTKDPSKLDSVLAGLDEVQATAYGG
ncbi:MAG: extracellular solute-binding protein [Chloroflexi bacterium]|nr:extracellular solute-binding protein [Chloroflexota bacterium]